AGGSAVISGAPFQDGNRNGVQDAGEAPLSGQQLYLFDSTGQTYFGTTTSDSGGRYSFSGLAAGTYRVEYANGAWMSLRDNWVPTTTGTLYPRIAVSLSRTATADFGWRPIVRSTSAGSPISSYVGSTGLRVESYDDAVAARDLYDALMAGLIGPEAARTTVRF